MKDAIVIALVAEKGAGKGLFIETVKKLLPGASVAVVRFSDTWTDILDVLGKEKSRHNISTLATALRQGFRDDGILIPAMRQRLANAKGDIIILDGLRKSEEVEIVRERNGLLVYIAADAKLRFERSRQRAEKTDEFGMTWEQFVRQEAMPTEVAIRTIGETMADVTLDNNGTRKEFEEKIEQFLKQSGFIEHHQ